MSELKRYLARIYDICDNRGGQKCHIFGCILRKANKELPASKSTTSTSTPTPTTPHPKTKNSTKLVPPEPSYYDQFLKTTPHGLKPSAPEPNTTWYELVPTDDFNLTTTITPEDELWESIGPGENGTHFGSLSDVEILYKQQKNRFTAALSAYAD